MIVPSWIPAGLEFGINVGHVKRNETNRKMMSLMDDFIYSTITLSQDHDQIASRIFILKVIHTGIKAATTVAHNSIMTA